MKPITDALQSVAVTLWAGGLWVTGFIFVPLLFARLGNLVAGPIAGKLFEVMAWVGIGCAAYLVAYRFGRFGAGAFKQAFLWIVLAMLALTLAGQFGVSPILESLREQALAKQVVESVMRERFATWHGVASGLYVIESLLALALVVLAGKAR